MAATLAEDPGKGWRTAGGRWEYLLAKHEKPRVRAIYSFDEDEVTISELEAFMEECRATRYRPGLLRGPAGRSQQTKPSSLPAGSRNASFEAGK